MKIVIRSLLFLLGFGLSSSKLFAQYNYYFGNLHAHSVYSDGAKDSRISGVATPEQCFRYASQSKHLDFLGISEHNHSGAGMRAGSYQKGLKEAQRVSKDGKFICLYGTEFGVTKNGGHVLIYGYDRLIGWEDGLYDIYSGKNDYSGLFNVIAVNPKAVGLLAHPVNTDYNGLIAKPYSAIIDRAISGVAIGSGPFNSRDTNYSAKFGLRFYSYYKRMLSLGYIVGPTMDHDNHYTTFGRAVSSRTVVIAKKLTEKDIIEAYHNNRFYASTDWNAKVSFEINGKPMGSCIKGQSKLAISAHIGDDDPGDGISSIKLYSGRPGFGEPCKLKATVNGSKTLKTDVELKENDAFYFFLDITQVDGDRIITAPIWASKILKEKGETEGNILPPGPPKKLIKDLPVVASPALATAIILLLLFFVILFIPVLRGDGKLVREHIPVLLHLRNLCWVILVFSTMVCFYFFQNSNYYFAFSENIILVLALFNYVLISSIGTRSDSHNSGNGTLLEKYAGTFRNFRIDSKTAIPFILINLSTMVCYVIGTFNPVWTDKSSTIGSGEYFKAYFFICLFIVPEAFISILASLRTDRNSNNDYREQNNTRRGDNGAERTVE